MLQAPYQTIARVVAGMLPLLVTVMPAGSVAARVSAAAPSNVSAPSSPVLVDGSGKCPKEGLGDPRMCWKSKFGNAETGTFHIPEHDPWGITWSYHCKKPGDFYVVVHLPGMDGFIPPTGIFRHGRRGRGYKMETNNWQATREGLSNPYWWSPQNLVIDSICSWHVRVVEGSAGLVTQYVPAIPWKG
jgi:hypothetical protein